MRLKITINKPFIRASRLRRTDSRRETHIAIGSLRGLLLSKEAGGE